MVKRKNVSKSELTFSPICFYCKNSKDTFTRNCKAFQEQNSIPIEIWEGELDHTQPYPGDNGIRFEPK